MREHIIVDCSTKEQIVVQGPDATLEETKESMLQFVKDKRNIVLSRGWSHDFGDPIGIHILDLRDADDKANWTLLLIKTSSMISAGAGAFPVEIRTAENISISIPATDANATMREFLAWGESILKRKWVLDTAITSANSVEELEQIDIESGWPA